MQGWSKKTQSSVGAERRKDMKSNRKDFYKYIASKMKAKDKASPLLNELEDVVTKKMEKAEILNTLFACVCTGKICLQVSQIPKFTYINLGEHNITHSTERQS